MAASGRSTLLPQLQRKGEAGTRVETVLDLTVEAEICSSLPFVTKLNHSTLLSLGKGMTEPASQSSGWL